MGTPVNLMLSNGKNNINPVIEYNSIQRSTDTLRLFHSVETGDVHISNNLMDY